MSMDLSQQPVNAATDDIQPRGRWKAWLVEILQARAGLYVPQNREHTDVTFGHKTLRHKSLAFKSLAHKKQA